MATKKKTVKKKPGPKPSGGPRVQVRFNTDNQVAAIKRAVDLINAGSKYGESITFNSFVVQAATVAAEEFTKKQ